MVLLELLLLLCLAATTDYNRAESGQPLNRDLVHTGQVGLPELIVDVKIVAL